MGQRLLRLEEGLAQFFLALTVAVIFAGGVARFLGRPLDWAMDLATFAFAWCVFLSADVALRQDRHLAVELLTGRLSPRWRLGLRLFSLLLMALFLALLFGYSLQMAYLTRFRSFQGIPGLSYTWVTLSVSVGSLLLLLTTLGRIRQAWRAWREGPCS
ncbi:Tripartite ATP-independent periplasmic transporter, DctQ component [Meiothermus luteus]|uniref:Tripartite ATP-independent periplasmic transporter, DctQ component n=1 Tax=Meiothermus luteus TaxID=2026184 RepID=A0A399EBP3_9DEIN|nr:TRAP transporter small permease subunit [Meiothermus luteus]RIH82074.1 Tripartite ATP-independent periplasmic transporter, DctQ component [Meiothermus luteus]RMH53548.1 MAG: TRAP transporter small permease subunit [Deinococcota bacterium]